MIKYIILCLDGLSDHPIKSLNGKTPLQFARTPHFDQMARDGCVGKMQNTPNGFKAGSDICNLSLMGYDVSSFHMGRAPYELAGMKVKQGKDELVFRLNLVSMDGDILSDFSSGHLPSVKSHELIKELNQHLSREGLVFHAGKSYRHILSVNTKKIWQDLDPFALKCAIPQNIMGQSIQDHLPQGGAGVDHLIDLMNCARELLEKHPMNRGVKFPANGIWLWSHGIYPHLESFSKKFGLTGSVISGVDLVKGIGHLLGLEVLDVPGATGYYDTDYHAKSVHAIKALKEKDFVFIHVEATDEAGHNGDLDEKIRAIENVDQLIVKTILNSLEPQNYRILIAPDHATPVELRQHTEEYVPFLLYGKGIPKSSRHLFDERILLSDQVASYDCGWELAEEFLNTDELSMCRKFS